MGAGPVFVVVPLLLLLGKVARFLAWASNETDECNAREHVEVIS
jgi:hypothetical protein